MHETDSTAINNIKSQPKAFITYARVDSAYRKQLSESLQQRQIICIGDWELVPGPDFFQQLQDKILEADVYIYLITDHSIGSDICQIELQHAEKLGKKILPVRIDHTAFTKDIPRALANPQWVIETNMAEAAIQIQTAVLTDFELLNQHTSLTTAAQSWNLSSGPLLKGKSLKAAISFRKKLLSNQLPYPAFTPMLENYIKAGKKAAFTRLVLSMVIVITVCLLAVILIQQLRLKEMERKKSIREQSYKLAFAAQNAFKDQPGSIMQSLLLAREAMKVNPSLEANIALRQALALTPKIISQLYIGGEMKKTDFSPDGKYFAAVTSRDSLFVWNSHDWKEVSSISRQAKISSFIFTDNFLIVIGYDSLMTIFDLPLQKIKNFSQLNMDVSSPKLCQAHDQIAIASDDAMETKLVLYNAANSTQIPFIIPGSLQSFALSHDDKWLATISDNNTIRLWNSSGKEQIKIDSLKYPEWVSFDTASKNMMIFNGNLYSYSLINKTGGYTGNESFEKILIKGGSVAPALSLGPIGRYGVSIADDRLTVHDLFNGRIVSSRWSTSKKSYIRQLFFSRDDQQFAAWEDNIVRVWDTRSGVERARFTYDGEVFRTEAFKYEPIKSVSLSPDGKYLAVALQSRDSLSQRHNPLYILETKGYISSLFFIDEDESRGISFGSDGRNTWMVSGGGDGRALVRIGNLTTGDTVTLHADKDTRIWTVCFSPHSNYLAFADADGTLWVWDWIRKTWLFKDDKAGKVRVLCFSNDGKYLAAAGGDNRAIIYFLDSPMIRRTLEHHDSINQSVNDVVFSPNGKLVATASDDNTACVWSMPEGQKVATLPHHAFVNDISFDLSGKFIATASRNNTATLWETHTGKNLFIFPHEKLVNKVVFSPDGKYLATASGDSEGLKGGDMTDGKITIWNVSTGSKVQEMIHPFTVWAICYNPDGKYIASSSSDGIVRIWEIQTGNEMARIRLLSYTPFPIEIQFSADGKYIGAPGEAYLWKPEDLIREADVRKSRELSPVEKKQFFGN